MQPLPEISVIIPVYNTEKYIFECLNSVITQTFTNIEIICINDGSTDNSLNILNEFAKKDSRIKIINQKNQGIVNARNNAISQACGKYIFPLDSDDIIDKNCLKFLHNRIVMDKDLVVTPMAVYFGQKSGEMFLPNKITKCTMSYCNCLTNSTLFPKYLFDFYGGYDYKFNNGLEDYDLWLKFIFHNIKFERVKTALFYYRIKEKEESRNIKSRQHYPILMQNINNKYPKIKFYKTIERIKRFFYKTKFKNNNQKIIRIFNIPIYKNVKKSINLHFYNENKNFGDLLNIDICKKIFKKIAIHSSHKKCEAIFIGSLLGGMISRKPNFRKKIISYFKPTVKIWGAGFAKDKQYEKEFINYNVEVYSVRGLLTLERLKKITKRCLDNVVVGDPGLLSSKLINITKVKKVFSLGIIPHYVDKNNALLSKINIKNSVIIDIQQEPETFLKQISECENIISSAMHGLIAADSLGIPNIRMILSDKIIGGDYKFNDYYSVFGITEHDKIDLNKQNFEEEDLPKIKANYKISQQVIEQICDDLIRVFPFKD